MVRHARQIVFQLAEVAVSGDLFAAIRGRLTRLRLAPGRACGRTGQVVGEKKGSIGSYEVQGLGWGSGRRISGDVAHGLDGTGRLPPSEQA